MKTVYCFGLAAAVLPHIAAGATGAAAMAAMAAKKAAAPAKDARPNIVVIMSDDHSYQTIGCYGYNLNKTPNLDRIAQSGAYFTRSFVANSLSGPARAVILTGKFSHKNGHLDNESGHEFDQSQTTFPKLLQAAGYQTAIFGKWHLGGKPAGFDDFSVLVSNNQQGTYYNPDFLDPDGVHKVMGYVTDITVDKSLDWLRNKHDSGKPFLLMCHFKAPHRNWMAAPGKIEMYEDTTFPVPDNFFDDYDGRLAASMALTQIGRHMHLFTDLKMFGFDGPGEPQAIAQEWNRMTDEQKAPFLRTYGRIEKELRAANPQGDALKMWMYQRYMRDYCKVISSVDDNVGRLLDYLQQNDLWNNTIVIYTSDQGVFMGEHGWFDKRWIYEESFRTPFLISFPDDLAKTMHGEQKAMIQSIDYAPTFLDYAGVPIPKDMQGESLRPLLEGKTDRVHDAIYYHYYEYPAFHAVKRQYGARTDRYKIVHFYWDVNRWELYDLEKDPAEMHNLYFDPAYTAVKDHMMDVLNGLQVKYDDPDPTKDNYTPGKNQYNTY